MIKYFLLLVSFVAAVCTFSSCNKDEKEDPFLDILKEGLEFLTDNAKRDDIVTTDTGLQYEVITPGNEDGKTPTIFNRVSCHYQGTFIDGKVFDSSYSSEKPVVFSLSSVIPGWTEGLQYMKEGAKYRFYIPYYLAYGARGSGPIPPYSTLIFDVELIEVL
ncbi:MAG: FKBP-type peptidyl-prolyl cis-trans isomerase [Bacteroidales bacterium]|nr:FKBP-type peptidyl-prolyl cis-trans isomerase [Bacteroidales bacterium]